MPTAINKAINIPCSPPSMPPTTINKAVIAQNKGDEKKFNQIMGKIDDFNDKREEIRLDAASVDKDGNLILNEKGGYQFTKEGAKKLAQQSKELNLSSFDFEPIKVLNPEGLEIYDFLSGWVDGVEFKLNIDDVEL